MFLDMSFVSSKKWFTSDVRGESIPRFPRRFVTNASLFRFVVFDVMQCR
jgi:hypothetical protein